MADNITQRNIRRNPYWHPEYEDDDIVIKKTDNDQFSLYIKHQNQYYNFRLSPEQREILYIDQFGNQDKMYSIDNMNIIINDTDTLEFDMEKII